MDEDDEYDDGYRYGLRVQKVYSLTEIELELLTWLPWFSRRRMIRRIREQTTFED